MNGGKLTWALFKKEGRKEMSVMKLNINNMVVFDDMPNFDAIRRPSFSL